MHVNTSQLRKGDVVHCYGMQLLIDQEIKTYIGTGSGRPIVYHTSAKVTNLEECKLDGSIAWWDEEGNYHYGTVPLSWLYPDVFRGGWVKDMDADPRWTIQGNKLAMWRVTRKDEAYSDIIECEKAINRCNELLFGKGEANEDVG